MKKLIVLLTVFLFVGCSKEESKLDFSLKDKVYARELREDVFHVATFKAALLNFDVHVGSWDGRKLADLSETYTYEFDGVVIKATNIMNGKTITGRFVTGDLSQVTISGQTYYEIK